MAWTSSFQGNRHWEVVLARLSLGHTQLTHGHYMSPGAPTDVSPLRQSTDRPTHPHRLSYVHQPPLQVLSLSTHDTTLTVTFLLSRGLSPLLLRQGNLLPPTDFVLADI